MSNIYVKLTIQEENGRSQTSIFQVSKICHQVSFGQLKLTKISLSFKTMCGFSITLILRGIITFENQTTHVFCRTKI